MNADTETQIDATEVDAATTQDVAAETPETTTQATQDRDENGKFRKPVQPRIDELTRKVRENEREAAYWRQRAEAAAQPKETEKAAEKPTPDKFADYGEYVEALADWKADQKIDAKLSERDKQAAEKQQAEKRSSTWNERAEAFRKETPRYDDVMSNSDVPIANHVGELLLESEYGPHLALHLAEHPEVADKLNALSPTAAAREIGRLEASFERSAIPDPNTDADSQTSEPAPVVKPKTTNAPPPAKPIGSGRSTSVDLAKAPMDDYVKQRKAQGARWAR